MVRDGWRLALGMLTVARTPMPSRVDADVARAAMLLAPLAAAPLGAAALLVALLGDLLDWPALVVGLLVVAVLALGSRALHLDGLSDTADGLTASHDPERSWAAMHTSTSGPAGGVAVVVVLALQAAALASLVGSWRGAVLAAVVVCLSRSALWLTCRAGVPAARRESLGSAYAGSVPAGVLVPGWVAVTVVIAGLGAWAGLDWWRGVVAAGLGALVVLWLVRRAVLRLGGVNGDVYGASIELCLAAMLVGLS